jgi:hypothetical protein
MYRFHSRNICNVDTARNALECQWRRNRIWKIIVVRMHAWLTCIDFNRSKRNNRASLGKETIIHRVAEYPIDGPTRFQWFSHLMRYNCTYGGQHKWKLSLLNYVSAFCALIRVYKRNTSQMMPTKGGLIGRTPSRHCNGVPVPMPIILRKTLILRFQLRPNLSLIETMCP